MTRPEDAVAAVASGADAIGLIFYAQSPRAVDMSTAVDANLDNFPQNKEHLIVQADILKLPFILPISNNNKACRFFRSNNAYK